MIVVRDIFRLKFGQSRQATELWKQAVAILEKSGYGRNLRLLTDMAGAGYYTLVLESTHDSVAAWEQGSLKLRNEAAWREVYERIIPLTEEGHREILSVV